MHTHWRPSSTLGGPLGDSSTGTAGCGLHSPLATRTLRTSTHYRQGLLSSLHVSQASASSKPCTVASSRVRRAGGHTHRPVWRLGGLVLLDAKPTDAQQRRLCWAVQARGRCKYCRSEASFQAQRHLQRTQEESVRLQLEWRKVVSWRRH